MSNIQQFDYSVNLTQVLLWQYNEAKNIQSLLQAKQNWYTTNHTEFWQNWYTDVFNLQTANDFGLAVWAVILNLPLQINLQPDAPDKILFGFAPEDGGSNSYVNFDNGTLSTDGGSASLTTDQKRLLLKLRYFQLVSRCAIPEINAFLKFAFQGYPGNVYVVDNLNMSISTIFTFDPGASLLYLIQQYDLIPRGAGVGIEYVVDTGSLFGFAPEGSSSNSYNTLDNGVLLPNY